MCVDWYVNHLFSWIYWYGHAILKRLTNSWNKYKMIDKKKKEKNNLK